MKFVLYSLIVLNLSILTSCTSSKDMVYFQSNLNSENGQSKNIPATQIPPHIIASGDLLSLQISTTLQSSTQILNQLENKSGFLVKSDSTVEFPLLGKMKLAGLTIQAGRDTIINRAKYYFTEPYVNLQLLSYKVMVFGEVKSPGIKTFNSENGNLLEAISQSGDLTDFGDRSNIKVIRNDSVYFLNLRDLKVMKSQGFYLQSNDVIYIQPVNRKFVLSNVSTSLTFISFVTTVFTLTSTIILLTRK